MGIAKADRKLMREINNMQVLQRIRAQEPISRPQLAEQTGLGLSTIGNIVTELLDNKLVREVGEGDSSGGRRPALLKINESARYAFGVKIGAQQAWISLFDLCAHQLEMVEISFQKEDAPAVVIGLIAARVQELRKAHRLTKRSVLGLGISTSGLIDPRTGVCRYSPILGWTDVPIQSALEELLKLDVIVENDVNAFAYGILLQESAAATRNMVCITTGPGVGAGIILNRRLYRGSSGGAGEFGHMTIDRHGPLCTCGRLGCLEVLASDQFLMARAREIAAAGGSTLLKSMVDEQKLSPTTLYYAAQVGDEAARSLYRELGENLGCGVTDLINLFNPDKIVIGGEGAVAAKFFLEVVRNVVAKSVFPHLADQVEIVADDGSEDVWLQGAAMLIIERFFEVPLAAY